MGRIIVWYVDRLNHVHSSGGFAIDERHCQTLKTNNSSKVINDGDSDDDNKVSPSCMNDDFD